MNATMAPDLAALGLERALDPPGTLLHCARRVDAQTPAGEFEAEVAVQRLALDATSFRAIRERCQADAGRMAQAIASIVAERGKLENPWTGSGGVLLGRVERVGPGYCMAGELHPGALVVPLASLIAIPLRLDAVGPVDPDWPQVPVRGRAIITGRMPCGLVPDDLRASTALAAIDVYPVASHVAEMAAPGQHVLVLGSGHAGLLAAAAAREAVGPAGSVSVVDRSSSALARAAAVEPQATLVEADATQPLAAAGELARRGLAPADLTLQCTSAAGAEATALLVTAARGTILFFSTATSFAAAALGADAIGSQPRLVIPNGLTDDRGQYAFDLLRRNAPLRAAFESRS